MRDMPILDAPKFEMPFEGTKNPGPGAVSLRGQEREGTGVCGQAHHRMLHGSNAAYPSANSALGAPRRLGESRPDLFVGRSMGSILAEGTAGAIFEIVEALVMSVEGRKVPGIVFTDSGSNMNFITHNLAQQLRLEGANTKIFLKVVDKDYTEKRSKSTG